VTMGIFNLITAIFFEAVLISGTKRTQQQLVDRKEEMEQRITRFIYRRFAESRRVRNDRESKGDLEEEQAVASCIADIHPHERVVEKSLFDAWIQQPDMVELFESVEIDTSIRFDLFDALDVDGKEVLHLTTIVEALMRLRGPLSKLDVVATRLKVSHIMRMVMDICRKLGVHFESYHTSTCEIFGI